jgi:hypothetical protein
MSRVKSPQEKKRLAYELDHRNASGESVKAWRRNKPLKKAKANRSFRKTTNDLVQATLSEDAAPQSATKKAGSIVKEKIIDWGPVRLRVYVNGRLAQRKATIGARKRRRAKAQNAE